MVTFHGPQPRDRVVASYRQAILAFEDFHPELVQWDLPTPCPESTLLDLSGHLLSVARYWHRLLDAAEQSTLQGTPKGY